jgi:hypothetical protein
MSVADNHDDHLYELTLRALPDRTPGHVRMRRLLKHLLRTWGFRLERIRYPRSLDQGDPTETKP